MLLNREKYSPELEKQMKNVFDETFHYNIVYDNNIELEELGISVLGKTVWVEQPNALAAFSQALMLFNGEI